MVVRCVTFAIELKQSSICSLNDIVLVSFGVRSMHVVFGVKPPQHSYHLLGSWSKLGNKRYNVTLLTGVSILGSIVAHG